MIWMLGAALAQPWKVGAAPSASAAEKGVAFAAHTSLGSPGTKGARLNAAFAPSKRLWAAVELGAGSGWRACPDCDNVAATATVRVMALNFKPFKLAAWGLGTASMKQRDGLVGAAAEIGLGPVRVEASVPIVGTMSRDLVLERFAEAGVRMHWNRKNATRLAMVGLGHSLALTHRMRVGKRFVLEGTAQAFRERQIRGELGVRYQL